jgi:pyruvate dehydrogenase (quinone)
VPVVYEAVTDPEVPPLPPHITLERARAFASSVLGGDAHAGRMVKESLRSKLPEFVAGRK